MAVLAALVSLAAAGCTASTGGGAGGSTAGSSAQDSGSPTSGSATPTVATPRPLSVSGLLGGTARPSLPAGRPGVITVVATGPLDAGADGAFLPIVIRNNTRATVSRVDITAVARIGGEVRATGRSLGTDPARIPPGDAALGYLYFDPDQPPTGSSYRYSFDTSKAGRSSSSTADLDVDRTTKADGRVTGSAVNGAGVEVTGPYAVRVYCFSAASTLLSVSEDFAHPATDQAPGARVTFSVRILAPSCPFFLVGVTGHYA